MPLAELKVRDRTLAVVESTLARHYRNRKGIDHINRTYISKLEMGASYPGLEISRQARR